MPHVEFEFVEIDEGHAMVTDEIGTLHAIPDHMVDIDIKELEAGDSCVIFLSEEYCEMNGVFI